MELTRVAVIGSGNIGPDIALHFAKVLEPAGGGVLIHDIAPEALERGLARIEGKLRKGVESGAFDPERAARIRAAVHATSTGEGLEEAELVIEAATEDLQAKRAIFAELEARCSEDTILASNSSHLPPDTIFSELATADRALNIHYFYPAERNPLVEIVPGAETDPELVTFLLRFYERIGKAPIRVAGRYGFAINPIFEGLFLAAARAVEDGVGSVAQVDEAARRALGLGVGPFTAMNLTGGNRITLRGLRGYHEHLSPWFEVPRLLEEQVAAGEPWPVAERGREVEIPPECEEELSERFQGTFLGLAGEVLESGIVALDDLEMGVEVGLVMRGPFQLADELGPKRVLELVRRVAEREPGFPVPAPYIEAERTGQPFDPMAVIREPDRDGIAILKIRRPRVLNALDARVFAQLDRLFQECWFDPEVKGVVLTGFGRKAFVSGADIRELAAIGSAREATEKCLHDQAILNRIEAFPKPVICAMNGLALGGGNELAMACHARVARPGIQIGQPEPNLGIIPGIGGSQRLPRWIGLEAAWPILRTGRPITAERAAELGLVYLAEGDPVEDAVELCRLVVAGEVELPRIPRGPIPVPERLPDVDIGHLSRRIDAILCEAILEGARTTLEEGLKIEARAFGACVETEDMKIGMRTFLEKGPRARAPFVHR